MWPVRVFCAARDAFGKFSNNWHLCYLVNSLVFWSSQLASERVHFKPAMSNPYNIDKKFPHWLQQNIIVNGIETYWPPHVSFLVWLCSMHIKTTRVTSQNYWHPLPFSQIWWPPLGCDVICGRPLNFIGLNVPILVTNITNYFHHLKSLFWSGLGGMVQFGDAVVVITQLTGKRTLQPVIQSTILDKSVHLCQLRTSLSFKKCKYTYCKN